MSRLARSLALPILANLVRAEYQEGDEVQVSINKVWPFSNPTETYRYYDFPFCAPDQIMPHFMTLGQVLRGDRLVNSIYKIDMLRNVPRTAVCNKAVTAEDIALFKNAIDANYMFELFVADLPIIRPFGVKSQVDMHGDGNAKEMYFLVNYLDYTIGYNKDEVVSVNVTSELNLEHLVDITTFTEGMMLPFFYSVQWAPSPIDPSRAMEIQNHATMPASHKNMDIHWLAIINSFVLMLLILSLFLLIIIRVVRSDLSRYLQIPDEELDAMEDETGWKLLHADVFRPPPHRLWFCACVGAGIQLLSMVLVIVLVGCVGVFHQRGAVASAGVASYMITAAVSGYCSAHLYKKLGGEKSALNTCVTCMAFVGPGFLIWSFLNSVAWRYGSTAAFPFPTIVLMFGMWALVTLPLTVLGGGAGRYRAQKQLVDNKAFPCKTNKLTREIPMCKWYQSSGTQFLAAGFLPFSAIYIELHYIFNSIWGPRIYYLYGILLLAFTMLLLVSATVTVLFTYFHLNAEDHRWWWRSFGSGGSVAFFFYAYCVYFFLQTGMTGLLQVSFFFLYSLLIAYALALVLGAVSFYATYYFVIYIYSRVKAE